MPDAEVAVFIDLENLRYSLLNLHGVEPDFEALVGKAKKYGRPSVMRAYADFSEHPPMLTRNLQVAGIEAINVPVKRSVFARGPGSVERIKNAADMVLALDAIVQALDADTSNKTKVFLLVTGDADYVKLVTLLRNRFGQQVIITGVPGSISGDLVRAAGKEDPIEVVAHAPVDRVALKRAIVAMVHRGPNPLTYWTLRLIDQWSQDPRQTVPGTARERRDAIGELRNEDVLVQNIKPDPNGRQIPQVTLDEPKARSLGYLS